MNVLTKPRKFAAAGACFAAISIAATGTSLAAGAFGGVDSAGLINACVNSAVGSIRIVTGPADCLANETALSWKQKGDTGAAGATGAKGATGSGSTGTQYTVHNGYLQLSSTGNAHELDLTCNYGGAGDNETFWFTNSAGAPASTVTETFVGGGVGGVYAFPSISYGQGGTNRVNPSSWPYQATFTLNEGGTLTRWDVTVAGSSSGPCTFTVYQNGPGSASARNF